MKKCGSGSCNCPAVNLHYGIMLILTVLQEPFIRLSLHGDLPCVRKIKICPPKVMRFAIFCYLCIIDASPLGAVVPRNDIHAIHES